MFTRRGALKHAFLSFIKMWKNPEESHGLLEMIVISYNRKSNPIIKTLRKKKEVANTNENDEEDPLTRYGSSHANGCLLRGSICGWHRDISQCYGSQRH